jgi:hypothetical protein
MTSRKLVLKRNLARIVFICALIALFTLQYVDIYHFPRSSPVNAAARVPTVAKFSMLYGGDNSVYVRALKSHERHAVRHGYPMHVLRHEVATGYWNKPSYLLSLLVQRADQGSGGESSMDDVT